MKRFNLIIAMLALGVLIVSDVSAFTGQAIHKWSPPTTFTDGSALVPATDLKEYRIYCGTTAGAESSSPAAIVSGGTSTTYNMTGLPVGTTYCKITAVSADALGAQESAKSPEASKTITAPASSGCSNYTMQ